jgi:hypothetical protein
LPSIYWLSMPWVWLTHCLISMNNNVADGK